MKKYLRLLALLVILGLFVMGQSGCTGCGGSTADTTKPSVLISSPADGSTVSDAVTVRATATDNVGVVKVEFYIDGSKVGEDASSPYEYSWNTDTLTYGSTHTIQAKAYDNAGNVGESPQITVTIGDTQAPQVTITNPQNGQTVSGTVTIQAQVTERSKKTKAPSGIAKVEFYIDNNKVGEDTSSPYEYSWNTTQYTDGTHTITAKAYDNAGNVGESPVISVTISAPVTFTDPNLEQAVRNTLGIPGGQPITRADMTRLTSLNAESKSIRSLSGLEYAINLQDLYLESNQINDINPLANLNNLQELHLGRNQISDISPLANLTNLQVLVLDYNQISNISPLANLTNLLVLYLYSNQINDINPLANLTNLQELHLGRNQISDISPLANLTNLQKLDLDYNQISNIIPLANLTNLQELVLDYNQISNIIPLANLTNLQELNLWLNQISDINPLANLTNLQKLVLGENQISDISPLVSNTGLGQGDYVNLEYNLLDLTPGSDDMQNIQILQNRGVTVYY